MDKQEVSNKVKRRTAIFLLPLFGLHFFLTVVYISPQHYAPRWVNQVAQTYMAPVFHQAWGLFAPDPPLQEKALRFRILKEDGWTDWIDPGVELLRQHDSWRISNANIAYRMHQNAAYRLWHEVYRFEPNYEIWEDPDSELEEIRSTEGYRTARFYVLRQYQKMHPNTVADSLHMRLIIDTPPPYPGRDGNWKRDIINLPTDVAR